MPTGDFVINVKHVFVGAGGFALKLLQKSGIPRSEATLSCPWEPPSTAAPLRQLFDRRQCQGLRSGRRASPDVGVHLDKRIIDEEEHLLFGPTPCSAPSCSRTVTSVTSSPPCETTSMSSPPALQNLDLVKFLIKELAASPKKKFAQLARFYPRPGSTSGHWCRPGSVHSWWDLDPRKSGSCSRAPSSSSAPTAPSPDARSLTRGIDGSADHALTVSSCAQPSPPSGIAAGRTS